jgi:hypothetical protein
MYATEVQANATASEEDRLSEEEVLGQMTYAVMHSEKGNSDKQPIHPGL